MKGYQHHWVFEDTSRHMHYNKASGSKWYIRVSGRNKPALTQREHLHFTHCVMSIASLGRHSN